MGGWGVGGGGGVEAGGGRVGGGRCFQAWNVSFRSYASLSFYSRFTKSIKAFNQVLAIFFSGNLPPPPPPPSNKNKMVASLYALQYVFHRSGLFCC